MYEIYANTFLKVKFVCAPSFLVCTHLTICASALRGNIAYNTHTVKMSESLVKRFCWAVIESKLQILSTKNRPTQGIHTRWAGSVPDPAPERVTFGPRIRLKNTRN